MSLAVVLFCVCECFSYTYLTRKTIAIFFSVICENGKNRAHQPLKDTVSANNGGWNGAVTPVFLPGLRNGIAVKYSGFVGK